MSEPMTGAAASVLGWKMLSALAASGAIGAALAAFVVMALTKPKTQQEWQVALICTVASSLGGGAAVIMKFDLQPWIFSVIGIFAIGGVIFACGLPGWIAVKLFFNYVEKSKDKTIVEVVKEVKDVI